MKYAHEHGCRWNKDTCAWAAYNLHFDCLRYAREHGCPISCKCADAEDAVTSLCVGMALSHRNEGGHISLREFLPLFDEYLSSCFDLGDDIDGDDFDGNDFDDE